MKVKRYVGTWKMANGTFFKVFETEEGKLVDGNYIEITIEELLDYKVMNLTISKRADEIKKEILKQRLKVEKEEAKKMKDKIIKMQDEIQQLQKQITTETYKLQMQDRIIKMMESDLAE